MSDDATMAVLRHLVDAQHSIARTADLLDAPGVIDSATDIADAEHSLSAALRHLRGVERIVDAYQVQVVTVYQRELAETTATLPVSTEGFPGVPQRTEGGEVR